MKINNKKHANLNLQVSSEVSVQMEAADTKSSNTRAEELGEEAGRGIEKFSYSFILLSPCLFSPIPQ